MHLLLLCIALALVPGVALAAPNIIFILADDQNVGSVSAYGAGTGGIASTPNIDTIASEGARFTNSFVNDPVCSPTRATLLTGRPIQQHGVFTIGDTLVEQQTIADLLKAEGYLTAVIGKWQLYTDPSTVGFDHYAVLQDAAPPYDDPDFYIDSQTPTANPGTYTTDLVSTKSLAWITANKDTAGPFFLLITHKAPHAPFIPPPGADTAWVDGVADTLPKPGTFDDRWAGRSSAEQVSTSNLLIPGLSGGWAAWVASSLRGKIAMPGGLSASEQENWIYQSYVLDYMRTVTGLDDVVGDLLAYLDDPANDAVGETGRLSANTVVIYTSDNGMMVGEHFSHGKSRAYDEALRVPLMIRYPGDVDGKVVTEVTTSLDWAPTILDFAEIAKPSYMLGNSLADLLDGSASNWRTTHYFEHRQGASTTPPFSGIRTSLYKLIRHDYSGIEWELIDLAADPTELDDIYGTSSAALISQLTAELYRQRALLGIKTSITGGTQSGVTLK